MGRNTEPGASWVSKFLDCRTTVTRQTPLGGDCSRRSRSSRRAGKPYEVMMELDVDSAPGGVPRADLPHQSQLRGLLVGRPSPPPRQDALRSGERSTLGAGSFVGSLVAPCENGYRVHTDTVEVSSRVGRCWRRRHFKGRHPQRRLAEEASAYTRTGGCHVDLGMDQAAASCQSG